MVDETKQKPQEYPKWMYHKSEPAVIVNDPAEEDELGRGWSDTYLGPETAPAAKGTKEAKEQDRLKAKPKPDPEPEEEEEPEPESKASRWLKRGKK